MPDMLDVSCPNCDKELKVPAEFAGKRVKCKDCGEVFPIKGPPKAKAPAAKPAPKVEVKPAPAPAPPPAVEEDDDDGPAKPMGVVKEDDTPRCPHCAKDLDPPDAAICLHCGFNNQTRIRAESKKVIASDATDWASHLAPPIIALIVAFGFIAIDIFCWINMRSWMKGSFLELEDKTLAGENKMIIPPGAFIAFIIVFSMPIVLPCLRFAFRRFIYETKPEEKVKK